MVGKWVMANGEPANHWEGCNAPGGAELTRLSFDPPMIADCWDVGAAESISSKLSPHGEAKPVVNSIKRWSPERRNELQKLLVTSRLKVSPSLNPLPVTLRALAAKVSGVVARWSWA
mmetsp:Transcript_129889/g.289824  ORF Transcript_129889/g.289824 Transcript_129889/m.289824 type:complete len:117 (-) Transcript_129889:1428-1778(-)